MPRKKDPRISREMRAPRPRVARARVSPARKRFIEAVDHFASAGGELLGAWDRLIQEDPEAAESAGYPFTEDFEETVLGIYDWADLVASRKRGR